MIKEAIAGLVDRHDLSGAEAEGVMGEIMRGEATPSQIGSFLTALRMKGETVEEIAGCARAMRSSAIRVESRRRPLVDTCGTGGDGTGTFNISTITAFVVAGCGVAVAKHGNRSVSSRCGSADLLEALGVKIELEPEAIGRCIDEVGIGFLFAQRLHPAMKNVAASRREMGIRTIFNILGPLTNPASASTQILGCYDPGLVEPLARVLGLLGSERAVVVHGAGGLDELSTAGPNRVARLEGGKVNTYVLDPASLGLPLAKVEALKGGDAAVNAAIALGVLKGGKGPRRDVVLLNAAAALLAAGTVGELSQGLPLAAKSIDSGAAHDKLQQLIALSNSF